ncbi:MAG: ABC transporter substrate-binding protein [Parcubacteria group bacterium]
MNCFKLNNLKQIWITAAMCLVVISIKYNANLCPCFAFEKPKTITVYSDRDPTKTKYGIYSTESEASFFITSGCYDTLFEWNPQTGTYVPQLAKSWSFKSPNSIVVKLRDGVHFHNGKLLTSEDVVESFKYINRIAEFSRLMLASIERITALDTNTLLIQLRQPDPLLIRRLSLWLRIYPCAQGYCNTLAAKMELPGTGPWKYLRREGNVFLFQANDRHWSGKVKPGSVLKVITDGMASLKNIESRDDELIVVDGLSWRERLAAKKYYDLNIIKTESGYADFGIFNMLAKDTIVRDIRIRKAINYALDRDALVRIVYRELVKATPSISITTDGGHDNTLEIYEYNLVKAKELLQQYQEEYPKKPLEIRIGMQSDGDVYERLAKYFTTSLAQVGIKVIRNYGYKVEHHVYDYKDAVDVVLGGDPSPYGHFDFFVQNFFIKGSLFQMLDDKMITEDYAKLRMLKSESEADVVFKNIDKMIHDQHMAIPGVEYHRLVAYDQEVSVRPIHSSMSLLKYIQ